MVIEKDILRKKLITARLALDKSQVNKKSLLIIQKLTDSVDWKKINKVHIYTALTPLNEIDTTPVRNFISENWPQIEVSTSPARKDAPMPDEQFDLIIVPVLGFDKNNDRLGMGGGWYDRFLSKQKKAITIGLAYNEALIDQFPREDHDIQLDSIITNEASNWSNYI